MVAFRSNLKELEEKSRPYTRKKASNDQGKQKPSQDANEEIKQRLIRRIQGSLELPNSDVTNKNEAVRIFAKDANRLVGLKEQWNEFVQELVTLHVKTWGIRELPADKCEELIGDIRGVVQQSKCISLDDDRVLSADQLKDSDDVVVKRLKTQINRMTFDITIKIFDNLKRLKSNQILGSISWADDEHCSFYDWTHAISATSKSDTEIRSTIRQQQATDNIDSFWVNDTTTTKRRKGSFLHMGVRTEQTLMLAKQSPVEGNEKSIPRQFNSAVEKIPKALASEIRLVSGESIRSERRRHVFMDKLWFDEKINRVIRPHIDPAITFGDTVLFAWDDVACHREKREQIADTKKEFAAINAILAVMALVFTVIAYFFTYESAGISKVVCLLPLGLGMFLSNRAILNLAEYRRISAPILIQIQNLSGWVLISVGASVGMVCIVNFSWSDLLVAIASLGLGLTFFIRSTIPLIWKS